MIASRRGDPVNRDRRTTAGSQLQGSQCYRCLGRGHTVQTTATLKLRNVSPVRRRDTYRGTVGVQSKDRVLILQTNQNNQLETLLKIVRNQRNLMNMKIFH